MKSYKIQCYLFTLKKAIRFIITICSILAHAYAWTLHNRLLFSLIMITSTFLLLYIGCTYRDGIYTKDGVKIERVS